MSREDIIERLIDQYREVLEQKDDEELLGSRLEDAKVLFANTLEDVREEAIERMVEQYQRQLDGKPDEELIGGQDDSEQ